MLSNKLKSFRVESYLFWWRFKDLFLISPIIIILTVFLSITMFERFASLEKKTEQSLEQIQGITVKENSKNLNKSY